VGTVVSVLLVAETAQVVGLVAMSVMKGMVYLAWTTCAQPVTFRIVCNAMKTSQGASSADMGWVLHQMGSASRAVNIVTIAILLELARSVR